MSTENFLIEDERRGATIDWSVLDALQAIRRPGGPDLRYAIMNLYLESSPALMEGVRAAFVSLDGESLSRAAHSLKSSSLNVGAVGIGALCKELESVGKSGDLGAHQGLLFKIQNEYAAVEAAFRDALSRKES